MPSYSHHYQQERPFVQTHHPQWFDRKRIPFGSWCGPTEYDENISTIHLEGDQYVIDNTATEITTKIRRVLNQEQERIESRLQRLRSMRNHARFDAQAESQIRRTVNDERDRLLLKIRKLEQEVTSKTVSYKELQRDMARLRHRTSPTINRSQGKAIRSSSPTARIRQFRDGTTISPPRVVIQHNRSTSPLRSASRSPIRSGSKSPVRAGSPLRSKLSPSSSPIRSGSRSPVGRAGSPIRMSRDYHDQQHASTSPQRARVVTFVEDPSGSMGQPINLYAYA